MSATATETMLRPADAAHSEGAAAGDNAASDSNNPFSTPPESEAARSEAGGSQAGDAGAGDGEPRGSNENLVDENEKTEEVPLTKWQRFKKHFMRRWYFYLAGFLIFLAIILPVFLLVVIPAIMQLVVSRGSYPVYSGLIRAVGPSEAALSLDTQFPGLKGLKIDTGTGNVSLFNPDPYGSPDTPFVTFPIPSYRVNGNTDVSIPVVRTQILNESQVVYWLKGLQQQKDWSLSLETRLTLRLGALKGKVHLKKTVDFPGLDNYGTISIPKANLQTPKDQSVGNLKGNIMLDNKSPLVVDIGNLTFNAKAGNLTLGQFKVNNFVSPPGPKAMPFTGNLNLGTLAKNLVPVLKTQKKYLTRGVLGIDLQGNSTIVNGQNIPYVEKVLSQATLKTEVPLSALLTGIVSGAKSGDLELTQLVNELVNDLPGDNKKLKGLLKKFGFTK